MNLLEFMSERIGVRVTWCCCVCNKCSWKVFETVQSCKLFSRRPLTPPSLPRLFFCKVFCECRGKNVHTEGSPNRVFFPSDSLPTSPLLRRQGHYTALCQVTQTSAPHCLMCHLNPTDTWWTKRNDIVHCKINKHSMLWLTELYHQNCSSKEFRNINYYIIIINIKIHCVL